MSIPEALPLRPKNFRPNREFDPTKYSTRLVAFKFAYLGQRYNGFEHHANNKTPLPTIEEELWKALKKAHLISPTVSSTSHSEEVNWEGCEYSKCGRTDKGVSAFSQVIGIRIRSNRPRVRRKGEDNAQNTDGELGHVQSLEGAAQINGIGHGSTSSTEDLNNKAPIPNSDSDNARPFHDIDDELPYIQILNRLLPEDIRILAWCPNPPPDFSARFSCRERRYRYFFTQPAFAPVPGPEGLPTTPRHGQRRREGWLDIEAMRRGARHFEGLHDFRNFCKVDGSKQITNFERRVFHADIQAVQPDTGPVGYIANPDFRMFEGACKSGTTSEATAAEEVFSTPRIYTFTVHGSAFLWHQVRHMAAILFLIGQGLESPSIVPALLDMQRNPTKPHYELADDAPLVLWDCIFPREGDHSRRDTLEWVYVGDRTGTENGAATGYGKGRYGMGGVVDDLWRVWRGKKVDEVLAGMLLDVAARQGSAGENVGLRRNEQQSSKARASSQKIFDGGSAPRYLGRYVPILERPRMESVEVANARYAARKGLETANGNQ